MRLGDMAVCHGTLDREGFLGINYCFAGECFPECFGVFRSLQGKYRQICQRLFGWFPLLVAIRPAQQGLLIFVHGAVHRPIDSRARIYVHRAILVLHPCI